MNSENYIINRIQSIQDVFKVYLSNPNIDIDFSKYIFAFNENLEIIKNDILSIGKVEKINVSKFNNYMTGVFRTFEGNPIEDELYGISEYLKKNTGNAIN